MKNKNKSAKVQKQIAEINRGQERAGKSPADLAKERERLERQKEKELQLKRKQEEAKLLRGSGLQQPKLAFGQDPKTVLCVFFKEGVCEKGSKCKYSHDRNVERKTAKANIYEDAREKKDDKATDTMDTWDETKLRSVVLSKTGNPKTTTDIVCKYFIQAIEDSKYGWFWECPNGVDCKYRHALPPGFVLKSEKKAQEEAARKEVISLEDFLETERHKLKAPLTPVTPESFAVWKKTRLDKKQAEEEAKEKAKAAQRAAGKMTGMSGRDMFDFGGDFLGDEDEDDDEWDLERYLKSRDLDARQEESAAEREDLRGNDDDEADAEAAAAGVGDVTNGVSKVDVSA